MTITIGIPAFNEQNSIHQLIESLLHQKITKATIEKIIVVSDSSTDSTDDIVKTFRNKKITLIQNKSRKGKAYAQDLLTKRVDSDILVIVDADTVIRDGRFIEKLIKPILNSNADLTAARIEELPATSFIGRVLNASMKLKKGMFYKYKNGQNLFTCCGRARAFSKEFYKTISFKNVPLSEDAYSYLACISRNRTYYPVKNAKVWYRLPTSLEDHQKQSVRFFQSTKELEKAIPTLDVQKEYKLPKNLLLQSFLQFIVKEPIILFYFPILIYYKLVSLLLPFSKSNWDIAKSSKKLTL